MYDASDLSCPHCGDLELDADLEARLARLCERLDGAAPRVASAYQCAAFRATTPWTYDPAHSEGRAVTFAIVDQYHRHQTLRAILDIFDRVWIQGTRVTCFVDNSRQPPLCIVV